jgi:hypothetical protein
MSKYSRRQIKNWIGKQKYKRRLNRINKIKKIFELLNIKKDE